MGTQKTFGKDAGSGLRLGGDDIGRVVGLIGARQQAQNQRQRQADAHAVTIAARCESERG